MHWRRRRRRRRRWRGKLTDSWRTESDVDVLVAEESRDRWIAYDLGRDHQVARLAFGSMRFKQGVAITVSASAIECVRKQQAGGRADSSGSGGGKSNTRLALRHQQRIGPQSTPPKTPRLPQRSQSSSSSQPLPPPSLSLSVSLRFPPPECSEPLQNYPRYSYNFYFG